MHYAVVKRGKKWALVAREWNKLTKRTNERTVAPGSLEWGQFGLVPTQSWEEAKEAFKRTKPARNEMWSQRVRARVDKERVLARSLEAAFLPPALVREFETQILPGVTGRDDRWLIVYRILVTIPVPPQDWFERAPDIFKLFEQKAWNLAYVSRLITYMNRWGAFYCRRVGQTFIPLERPKGLWKQRLMRAYNEGLRSGKVPNKETRPLRVEDLVEMSRTQEELAYSGTYLMFWLGLRQRELKQILERDAGEYPGGWWLEKDDERFPVLHVFQEKLAERGIKDTLCWKCIPLSEPEQQRCVEKIEKKAFKVPRGYNTRRARLGYSVLMEERGYRAELIQDWLGHVGKTMRDRHYKERRRARWEPPVVSRQSA